MRTHPRGLTKLTATLAVVAMSFGLAACGGSSDTGGAGDKSVTVWMSVDPLVFDGLQKEIGDLLKAHFGLRMQKATQQLSNHTQLGNTRRDIARAKTILAQKQKEAKK